MRNFFIKSFEFVASIIVALGFLILIVGTVAVAQSPEGGIARAIGVLFGGFVYLALLVGSIYLVIGIHDNTKRTALAVEELLRRQR